MNLIQALEESNFNLLYVLIAAVRSIFLFQVFMEC
jgi:hypothetical protein